jgi:hypothetical protein
MRCQKQTSPFQMKNTEQGLVDNLELFDLLEQKILLLVMEQNLYLNLSLLL